MPVTRMAKLDPYSRETAFNFSQTTSAHGIPHIGRAKTWTVRAFWTAVFLIALSLLIWQVSMLIAKYRQYDKVTKMELKFQRRPFPAVTVCNLNPYLNSDVNEDLTVGIISVLKSYEYQLAMLNNKHSEHKIPTDSRINKTMFQDINDTVALQSKAKEEVLFLAHHEGEEKRRQMSYSLLKLVKSCSFNTEDCDMEEGGRDFEIFMDPKYGNCWSFNYKKVSSHNSTRAGPLYGLRMVLSTKHSEYLPISESSGIRVVVHNQTEYPFPDTFGYNAASGYSTSLGISYREITRLPKPYGDCTDKKSVQKQENLYMNGRFDMYTMEGCFRSCIQTQVSSACRCSDPRYVMATNKSCHSTDKLCMERVDVEQCKQCPQPCEQGVYDVTVSTARWPSGVFQVPGCYEDSIENCTKESRENALMLEVFFEQLNYKLLTESAAYTMVNLVSDFGGQAGLWLGVSVVTAVEVLVLVFQLVCCRKYGKDKVEDIDGRRSKKSTASSRL